MPKHGIYEYQANQNKQIFGIVEMPTYVTDDLFDAGIDNDGQEFFVKMDQDEIFTDFQHINGAFREQYGRHVFDDSSLTNSFKKIGKQRRAKKKTLRIPLPFVCEKEFAKDVKEL